VPHASMLVPHASMLVPHASMLVPHASMLVPHASWMAGRKAAGCLVQLQELNVIFHVHGGLAGRIGPQPLSWAGSVGTPWTCIWCVQHSSWPARLSGAQPRR